MKTRATVLIALAALLGAGPALAFRCQGKLIKEGDLQAKVRRYCGDPVAAERRFIYRGGIPTGRELVVESGDSRIETRQELLVHDRSVVEVLVEVWTYNFGPHRLMRVVRFEDGVVAGVDTRGYGYHD